MTRPRILISVTLTRHFPASISTSDVFVLGPFSLSTGTLLELCVLCCELILAITLQNNRKQNRIIFGSFCSGGEASAELFFFFFPSVLCMMMKRKAEIKIWFGTIKDTPNMHKLTPCKFWMYADWLEDVCNRMIAGILFISLLGGFEEQITYTPGLLEDNWAAFRSYTSGRYTCRHQQRGQTSSWRHRCRDTEGSHVKVLSYFLWSFWTSLSSSSFSLVIKLCRTGISNLIYCATWWNTDDKQAKQEKRYAAPVLNVLQCYIYRHQMFCHHIFAESHHQMHTFLCNRCQLSSLGLSHMWLKTSTDCCGDNVENMTCYKSWDMFHYIVCHFFSKVFFHEENLADLLTGTLHDSQHQRIVAAL